MKIIVDAFGGDNAPNEIINGAVMALEKSKSLEVVLCGNEKIIQEKLSLYKVDMNRIEVLNALQVVTNEESPTKAIKEKTDSSLVVAMNALKNREDIDAFVSAGSTGAVLTGGLFVVGRMKGIQRPALAATFPTVIDNKYVLLVDCGANVDCKPSYLTQFAIMGSCYMKAVYGIENPKVGLLSNGTEDKKGNDLNKQAFALLKEMKEINFVGNMEARDNLSGDYDVIVTDGFAGNIALKTSEGVSNAIFSTLKQEIKKSFPAKLGALMMKKAFKAVKAKLDYNTIGGAPLLGLEKIVVKAHGSSKGKAFCNAILQAQAMASNNMIENIKKEAVKFTEQQ